MMQLPGRLQHLARKAWYVCAALVLGLIVLSFPTNFNTIAEQLPISLLRADPFSLLFIFNIASSLTFAAAALISFILSIVLFLKRSDDGMAVFLSYFLLAYSVYAAGPSEFLESLWPGISAFSSAGLEPILFAPLLIILLSIFPNGHLVPGWTRWLIAGALLYAPINFLLINAEALSGLIGIYILGIVLWFGPFFAGLYAQIFRYRHISSPTERQQTKWVIYGFSLELVFAFFATIGTLLIQQQQETPWWALLVRLSWSLSIIVLPIFLTIAVMRYRLYDIDFIINRSLVYGALTGSVILLYVLIVGVFGILFQSAGNLILALLATGLVAALFNPIRVRLQQAVNRMMYGERDEPFTVLRRLGQRLEGSGTPEDILKGIVETVAQALKLPYTEITLHSEEGFKTTAGRWDKTYVMVSFPIQYQSQTIGDLSIAPRWPGESLSDSDEGLLRQIARQAGPVAHTVQLTQDLRESHKRLVTTREEERHRLRRDLHDGLGPVLASQGLKIAAVSNLFEEDTGQARILLDELASQNETTVAEIRRLVYNLRPLELDELGLVRAVLDYTSTLDLNAPPGTSFQVNFNQAEGKLHNLPPAVEVAAYRIATEALTNVARHARARHCTITLKEKYSNEENRNSLILEIEDDGVGLPLEGNTGVGLISMRERANEVGGEFQIESDHSKGTRIVACFPLTD
jgi:signal transduction histidine kinase